MPNKTKKTVGAPAHQSILPRRSTFYPPSTGRRQCCLPLLRPPSRMAASSNVHRSTKSPVLRRRGTCSHGDGRGSSSASRFVLSLVLPVVLLLRGGSAESATQVGAGAAAAAAAHRYFASPSIPGVGVLAEAFPAEKRKRREACGRRSRAHKTSFVANAQDDGNRLRMPRIGGIRQPDRLVSVWWGVATGKGG